LDQTGNLGVLAMNVLSPDRPVFDEIVRFNADRQAELVKLTAAFASQVRS